ncbi:MAG: DUF4180 domain-containing protein [Pseudomonadota bacterium]
MTFRVMACGSHGVLALPAEGPVLGAEADLLDLMGEAMGRGATWIAAPAERLGPDFFRLETRLAGTIAQKLVNYRLGLAVVGDVSALTAKSRALRDWVYESNRGRHVWFMPDLEALAARLSAL